MTGPGELILVLLVVTVLLSWRKLPDMSRTVGRAFRGFRSELRGWTDGDLRSKASAQLRRGKLGRSGNHDADAEDQR